MVEWMALVACRFISVVVTITDLFCSGSSNIWATLSDRGRENVGISLFMLNHPQHGPGCGSMLVGRSVHNQRSTMTCFCTLNPLTFLTHSMTSICSAYTLYLFLASMFTFNRGSLHGFIIHYVQLGATPPCNFGLRVCL